jgi:ATP-dependent Clp protease adapter protein ClpS
MISFLKLIALTVAAQVVVAAAFVSNGSHSPAYRSVQVQGVRPVTSSFPSTTRRYMAVDAPAPVKKKEKKVTNESDTQGEAEKDRGYLVRLYNDPMNKREFVAKCLMEICGLDDGMSFNIMMKAHQVGIAVIGNYHRELAEMYKMRLSGEGLLIDMVPADDE